MEKIVEVPQNQEPTRLDVFLSQKIESLSRTKINVFIENGDISVDGKQKKPSYVLRGGEKIFIYIKEESPATLLKPFFTTIDILYEDDDILVINKKSGLVVHPPHQNYHETLVNVLIGMKKKLSTINSLRPGIVHRLDKETSGVMVVAKNNKAHLNLINQFKERSIKKNYYAIVWGLVEKDFYTVDLPLARDTKNRLKMKVAFVKSRNAHTDINVHERFDDSTILKIALHTGRMHQIRVHLKFLGYPIIGDKKYGIKDEYNDLFLHSYCLGLYHPTTQVFLEFVAPLPDRFKNFIAMKGGSECIK